MLLTFSFFSFHENIKNNNFMLIFFERISKKFRSEEKAAVMRKFQENRLN